LYKELEKDLLAFLQADMAITARHAGTKAQRLAQVCAGFTGGVEVEVTCAECGGIGRDPDHALTETCGTCGGAGVFWEPRDPVDTGTEKLDFLVDWVKQALTDDEELKLLVWCRFRHEVERTVQALKPLMMVGPLWGGQSKAQRTETLTLLNPRACLRAPAAVVGTAGTGALGLDMTASHTVVYLSNDTKLVNRLQSMARVDRPGQVAPVSYLDVLATGPSGQRTIDHVILAALKNKEDVADWTAAAWIRAFTEEFTEEALNDGKA
jgi:hypothetical protein